MLNTIAKHKSTINNFFYLTVLRLFNIATKFFLVAYLVRVLGEKVFGLLTWSDSILQYCIIIMNFGFNIFGSKYIAKYKSNKKILNDIVSSIYIIKVFFLGVVFIILFVFYYFQILEANFTILFLLLFSAFGDLLYPIWYFQGIEKLKPLTKIAAISKFILLCTTLIFVKSLEDIYNYIYFFIFCQILMGLLSFLALIKDMSYSFKLPNTKIILILNKAKLYFLGNISMLVFNAFNIFLIGIYVSLEKVTSFDISLKIIMLFLLPFEILQAIFIPMITKNKSKKTITKAAMYSFLIGVFLYCMVYLFGENILVLFGGANMSNSFSTLKIISLILFTVPTTYILQGGLISFGYDKLYNHSLIIICVVYFFLLACLFSLDQIEFFNLLYLRVFLDYLLLILILILLRKKKFFHFYF